MTDERLLRGAAVVYAIGLALHTTDHLRRGLGAVTLHVLWAGNLSTVVGAAAVVLIVTRHRLGPAAAMAAGLPIAIGVAAVHALPTWSAFSDSFVDERVSWMSWTVVSIEIAGALATGLLGWRVWSAATRTERTTASTHRAPA